MWTPIYSTAKAGKRFVKSWTDGETTLSNRKYQERYGSVAKSGFRTPEVKASANVSYERSFDLSGTTHYNHNLPYTNPEYPEGLTQIEDQVRHLLRNPPQGAYGMMLTMFSPDAKVFSTLVWEISEIGSMLADLAVKARKYTPDGDELSVPPWISFTIIGLTQNK